MPNCYHVWILILNIVHFCYAGDINCENYQDPNCFKKTINCVSDGKNCTIHCNANQACRNSIINCAPSVGCFIHCSKYQSCLNVIINGGSATTLSVQTSNSITQTLNSGQINCQNVLYCDVTCNQRSYQCRNTQIKAEDAGQLIVKCEGNKQYTNHCQGMDIYCPKKKSKCWLFSPIVLTQVDIYSQFGFDGVAICGEANPNSIGNMHCGSEYDTTCLIHAFSVNYCDAPSPCDAKDMLTAEECIPPAPTTFTPTLSPTNITSIPTSIPTIQPTISGGNNFILTTYPSVGDIKLVTKTVMVLARDTDAMVSISGFAVVLSVLLLMCCVVMCIAAIAYTKMKKKFEKLNVTHSKDRNISANELQQLTIPGNNGLILYRDSGSSEGNGQYISKMNDETEKCEEKYEGLDTNEIKTETCQQTYQIEMIQNEKQLVEDITDEDELYGPGSYDSKTHGNKHVN